MSGAWLMLLEEMEMEMEIEAGSLYFGHRLSGMPRTSKLLVFHTLQKAILLIRNIEEVSCRLLLI